MNDFLIGIGKRIKAIRKKRGITISVLAASADVSNGLISRVENGRTIPSLPVLLEIINALEIDVSTFFEDVEKKTGAKYIHIKKEHQEPIEKEVEAEGFSYQHVFSKSLNAVGFEAVLLTISPNSKRSKVTTDAWEFKYVLSGECSYFIEEEEILIKEKDSLYFNGRLPHVPINKGKHDCVMLVFYFYSEN